MWKPVADAHPQLDRMNRNDRVWLYDAHDPEGGVFLGSYVRFDEDEPAEVEEYAEDGGRPVEPTHFWDGDGEPSGLPIR